LSVKNGLIIGMYCITEHNIYNLVLHKIHTLYTNDNLYLPMFELTTLVKIAFCFYTCAAVTVAISVGQCRE
jgi:hypothetical protein